MCTVHPRARSIRINGQVVPIPSSREEYQSAGITLEDPNRIWSHELMRYLAIVHADKMFLAGQGVDSCRIAPLPRVLRLHEWHHREVLNGEKPSQTQCFRMIADVLATGDPSRYKPVEPPNTHWSNWPGGGTL